MGLVVLGKDFKCKGKVVMGLANLGDGAFEEVYEQKSFWTSMGCGPHGDSNFKFSNRSLLHTRGLLSTGSWSSVGQLVGWLRFAWIRPRVASSLLFLFSFTLDGHIRQVDIFVALH